MLPLHKLSNVLFLWSGLFVDGPEECPGFCVLFCGRWRFCFCRPVGEMQGGHHATSWEGLAVAADRQGLGGYRAWSVGVASQVTVVSRRSSLVWTGQILLHLQLSSLDVDLATCSGLNSVLPKFLSTWDPRMWPIQKWGLCRSVIKVRTEIEVGPKSNGRQNRHTETQRRRRVEIEQVLPQAKEWLGPPGPEETRVLP